MSVALLVLCAVGCSDDPVQQVIAPESKSEAKPEPSEPNVVLVMIDTQRADHLGCYGYDRDTSPFMDSLAAEGLRFQRAYSPSTYTRTSVASLFNGYLPSRGGHEGMHAKPSADFPTIAEHFKERGYHTALFSNTPMIEAEEFTRGFDVARIYHEALLKSGLGPQLSERAAGYISANAEAGNPVFVYVHYMDPHSPWGPPPEYLSKFERTPLESPFRFNSAEKLKLLPQMIADGFGPGEPHFDHMIDRYDAETAHTDYSIKLLYRELEKAGIDDNTLFIVTADHGEEFTEHGFVGHTGPLYEESIHVPLILHFPKRIAPGVVTHPVSMMDVYSTLLDCLWGANDPNTTDAYSLLEVDEDSWRPVASRPPVLAEFLFPARMITRVAIDTDLKYMSARRWPTFEHRMESMRKSGKGEEHDMWDIWGPVEYEALFDPLSDPTEQVNLLEAAEHDAQRADELRGAIEAYHLLCDIPQKMTSAELDAEEIEMLKALGYLD